MNNRKLSGKIKDIIYGKVVNRNDKNVKEDISQNSLRNNNVVDGRVKRTEKGSNFDEKLSDNNDN